MDDLLFQCFKCNNQSPFEITVANRDEVMRLHSDGKEIGLVNFICVHCGYANLIEITLETATKLLERLSSRDPEVQKALDSAKSGNFSEAIAIAAKKLGFRF